MSGLKTSSVIHRFQEITLPFSLTLRTSRFSCVGRTRQADSLVDYILSNLHGEVVPSGAEMCLPFRYHAIEAAHDPRSERHSISAIRVRGGCEYHKVDRLQAD